MNSIIDNNSNFIFFFWMSVHDLLFCFQFTRTYIDTIMNCSSFCVSLYAEYFYELLCVLK